MTKKIAIVYDWMDSWGGVERVLLTLHEMYPEAIFYTSYVDYEKAPWAKKLTIKTSFIQHLPSFIKKSRLLSFFLYPYAFESFDFSGYNTVISVTSSFAKGVITKPDTLHICYLLTPTRYLWLYPEEYVGRLGILGRLGSLGVEKMKMWDKIAAQRPDKVLSISRVVAERCKKYYGRDSEVVYPPFDLDYWTKIKNKISLRSIAVQAKIKITNKNVKKGKYYLVVSRLEPYKRVDLAIEAFNNTDRQLVIVGTGSREDALRGKASKNITFISNLEDQELVYLYSHAEALIMPQEEDFGYVALEAQYFGCPVIAYSKGGAQETILDGKTGILFDRQDSRSIVSAVEKYEILSYNIKIELKRLSLKHIEKFAKVKFIHSFNN